MNVARRTFLAGIASAFAIPRVVRAQDDIDPAISSSRQALRVLLGRGDATAAPGGGVLFNGRTYRGTFVRSADGSIVNVVDLEQYLYAVVSREMPVSWPNAALQAQAICARTYVLQRSNPRRDYDLVPSEADQVYLGVAGESPNGRSAVDATAGQVLRFGAGFASIAYSSCCGGHTESSAEAWGNTFFPYLAGVACPYCSASPNYRWTVEIARELLEQRLARQLAPLGNLQNVRITQVDGSGRARGFELQADRGTTVVKGSAFRLSVGARVVRSLLITNLRVDPASAQVAIEGAGLGHGVGLCQWGAQGLARTGAGARDILAFYLPGTQIGTD